MRGLCRPRGTSRPRGPSSRGRASPKQRFSARNRNASGTRPQSMVVLDAPRCPVGARGRAGLRCCHPHRARSVISRGEGSPPRVDAFATGAVTLRWRYTSAFAARSSLRGFGSLLTAEDVWDAFVALATRGRAAEEIGGRPHVVGDPRVQCRVPAVVPGRGL